MTNRKGLSVYKGITPRGEVWTIRFMNKMYTLFYVFVLPASRREVIGEIIGMVDAYTSSVYMATG